MKIRRAAPAEREILLDIWLRSVRATHAFLSAEDVRVFLPLVREYLAAPDTELWVLAGARGEIMGFMGMAGSKIEALFLAPEHLGRGGGTLLVEHARSLHPELRVDVNEQNEAACRFYLGRGFVVEGRSELDAGGRPFPLLHMRRPA